MKMYFIVTKLNRKKKIMLPFVLQNICRLFERSGDKNYKKHTHTHTNMKNTFRGFGKGLDGCERPFEGCRGVKTSLTSSLSELPSPC